MFSDLLKTKESFSETEMKHTRWMGGGIMLLAALCPWIMYCDVAEWVKLIILCPIVVLAGGVIWRMRKGLSKRLRVGAGVILGVDVLLVALEWHVTFSRDMPVVLMLACLLVIAAFIYGEYLYLRGELSRDGVQSASVGMFLRKAAAGLFPASPAEDDGRPWRRVRVLMMGTLVFTLAKLLNTCTFTHPLFFQLPLVVGLIWMFVGFVLLIAKCKTAACCGMAGCLFWLLGHIFVFWDGAALPFVLLLLPVGFFFAVAFWSLRDLLSKDMTLLAGAAVVVSLFFSLPDPDRYINSLPSEAVLVFAIGLLIVFVGFMGVEFYNDLSHVVVRSAKQVSASAAKVSADPAVQATVSKGVAYFRMMRIPSEATMRGRQRVCVIGLAFVGALSFVSNGFIFCKECIDNGFDDYAQMVAWECVWQVLACLCCLFLFGALASACRRMRSSLTCDTEQFAQPLGFVLLQWFSYFCVVALLGCLAFCCLASDANYKQYEFILGRASWVQQFNLFKALGLKDRQYVGILVVARIFYAYVFAMFVNYMACLSILSRRPAERSPAERA